MELLDLSTIKMDTNNNNKYINKKLLLIKALK